MTTVSKQIATVLEELIHLWEIDGANLSLETGVPTTTINRLRNGDIENNPTINTLLPLANYFGVSISQLIDNSEVLAAKPTPATETCRYPILTWEETTHLNKKQLPIKETLEVNEPYYPGAFVIETIDHHGPFLAGGYLIIHPTIEPNHGDYVLIQKGKQTKPSIKQLLIEDDHKYLKSLLLQHQIEAFTNDFKLIGVVMEFRKKFRR